MKPVMFEGMMANGFAPGGQLTTTTDVENYPGFPEGVLGGELMDKMRAQSIRCGTVIETETITKLDVSSRPFKIWREGSENHPQPTDTASAVVFATGASARRMHLPGEDKYWQNGISACAVCDGAVPIFRNKPLVVVGGGDSAAEESIYLTKCKLLHRTMKLNNDVVFVYNTRRISCSCPCTARCITCIQGDGAKIAQTSKDYCTLQHRCHGSKR